MQKSTFRIPKMDCAGEEQLIRLRLEDFGDVASLRFDIPARRLEVLHRGDGGPILAALESLQLGATLVGRQTVDDSAGGNETADQKRLLRQVLGINFFLFVFEMLTGLVSDSMALVADSLDMLADSLVYGLALFAVGASGARKKAVARTSGYFQLTLAAAGLVEVARRFFGYGEMPAFEMMIAVSLLALTGNAVTLYLLQKSRSEEAHMRASVIFTSNDVIVNIGVIVAGVAVLLSGSRIPDLIVGSFVFLIVARGAVRILRLAES